MNTFNLEHVFRQIAGLAAITKQEDQFPHQAFTLLALAGLLNIVLPEKTLSFKGDNTAELLSLLKQTGKASLPVGRIYEGHINALHLVYIFGKPDQQERWYSQADSNQLFGVWNTEDADGVKIIDKGNGRYLLEGSKTFCSGAQWLNCPLVTGKLTAANKTGWQMFIIPPDKIKLLKPDSSFWNPLGMKASVSYKMDLTGIELDEADLLGEPDDYYSQPYFSGGAIRFAAVQLGGAEAIQDAVHNLLNQMKRTGDTFQQARMAKIAYLIETGNLWINQAGQNTDKWVNEPQSAGKIVAYANLTRSVMEELCLKIMQLAERSVGSRGLMKPGELERVHRDLTTYLRQPGPDAAITSAGNYLFNQQNLNAPWI